MKAHFRRRRRIVSSEWGAGVQDEVTGGSGLIITALFKRQFIYTDVEDVEKLIQLCT